VFRRILVGGLVLIFLALAELPRVAFPAAAPGAVSHADEPYSYIHHAVSTHRPAAQEAFDRGLTLVYAYQSAEAEQSFRQAAKLDPQLAMAWWGVGLALGPNINASPDLAKTHQAAEALRRAAELAGQGATASEQAYIAALAMRYSAAEKPDYDRLSLDYRGAMRRVVEEHPEDSDAAALYAEAIMDLRPWQLWNADRTPAPDTEELVGMLEAHIARAPTHMGLLHLYLHAVEAGPHPERALDAAHRLAAEPMEPAAAHLVHMPAHIYLRTGDWTSAIEANQHSVRHALDFKHSDTPAAEHACGHCLDFLRYAHSMVGNFDGAREAAEQFQELNKDPTDTLAVLLRFRRWDDVLIFPEPPSDAKSKFDSPHFVQGFWHFARGLALVGSGRIEHAESELAALRVEFKLLPAQASQGVQATQAAALDVEHTLDRLFERGNREALTMADLILGARLAEARKNPTDAVALLRKAVNVQDAGAYSEPPVWYYPIRESLGGALLKLGQSAQAEAVFREDLRRNPHNPRSLYGLAAALRAQHREAPAAEAQAQFRALWQPADVKLEVAEF
jgi:tetratricopeptide (TPR) repeat protein